MPFLEVLSQNSAGEAEENPENPLDNQYTTRLKLLPPRYKSSVSPACSLLSPVMEYWHLMLFCSYFSVSQMIPLQIYQQSFVFFLVHAIHTTCPVH
jgi:hypothetical protein